MEKREIIAFGIGLVLSLIIISLWITADLHVFERRPAEAYNGISSNNQYTSK